MATAEEVVARGREQTRARYPDDEGYVEREGVRMEFLASPVEVLGKDGHVTGVKFIRNRLGAPDASGRRSPVPIEGSEFVIPADVVIPAVAVTHERDLSPVRRPDGSKGIRSIGCQGGES